MTVRILPRPAGAHSRRGPDAAADAVRHGLLRLVVGRLDPDDELGPWTPGLTIREVHHREWHAVACALGELVERVVAWVAVVACAAIVLPVVALTLLALPWWLTLAGVGTAAVGLVVWQLVLAGRRFRTIVAEELPDVDSDATDVFPIVDVKQDKENER